MYKWISGLWPKQKSRQEQLPLLASKEENAFIIAVDKRGNAILRISIQLSDQENAVNFAKALFGLQSGMYKDQIAQMLDEIGASEEGPRVQFAGQVLKYYETYFDMLNTTNYNKEDRPVVSPLKFSSLVINGDK